MKSLLSLRPAPRSAALWPFLMLATGVSTSIPALSQALAQAPVALPPLAIPAPAPTAPVLISELRASGPRGKQDAFVELFNNTSKPISLAGWSLRGRDAKGAALSFPLAPGTQVGARAHLLLVGRDYSLGNVARGDRQIAPSFDLSRGVRLVDAKNKLIDAVGPASAAATHREGAGLPVFAFAPVLAPPAKPGTARPPLSQFSLVRQAIDGQPQDTGDNARDFALVSVSGAIYAQKTRIGTPGPENAASPRLRPVILAKIAAQNPTATASTESNSTEANSTEANSTEVSATDAPALQLIALQTDPGLNSMRRARRELGPLKTHGTMTLRYRLVNDSPNPIQSLSFRVNSISSDPSADAPADAPAGLADVRLIRGQAPSMGADVTAAQLRANAESASSTESGAEAQGAQRTLSVWPARLAPAPSQPLGGALNALLNVELPAGGIAPGARGEIHFLFGVERTGRYRVVLGNQTMNIVFEGDTEADLQTIDGQQVAGNGGPNGSGARTTGGPIGAQPSEGVQPSVGGGDTPGGTEDGAGEGIVFEGNTEDGVPTPPVGPSTGNS